MLGVDDAPYLSRAANEIAVNAGLATLSDLNPRRGPLIAGFDLDEHGQHCPGRPTTWLYTYEPPAPVRRPA